MIKVKRLKFFGIFLKIYVAKPGVIITETGSGLIDLTKKLKKLLPRVNKISIDVFEISEPDTHAILLAQFISNQLVRRVAFKRAVRKAIERAQAHEEIKGIKVQIAGRLNGAEIARTEWVKEGRMPLQTLRANIDYATASSKTASCPVQAPLPTLGGEIADLDIQGHQNPTIWGSNRLGTTFLCAS